MIIYHPPALQELDVWGGDFYTDEFYAAAQQLGPGLTKLNLVHVEELDTRYSTVQYTVQYIIGLAGSFSEGGQPICPAKTQALPAKIFSCQGGAKFADSVLPC